MVVQWFRLSTSTAGGEGSIPSQRTKILRATNRGQKKGEGIEIPVSQSYLRINDLICAVEHSTALDTKYLMSVSHLSLSFF